MNVKIAVLLPIFALTFFFIQSDAANDNYKGSTLLYKGWIKGKVTHAKKNMEVPQLEIERDVKVCGSTPRVIDAINIGPTGALRNAVVYIKEISKGKPFVMPAKPPELRQENCGFDPHVQIVHPKSTIRITNSDNVLHTVHAFQFPLGTKFVIYPHSVTYPAQTLFNIAMIGSRKETFQQLGGPGIIKFICEAGHYWMTAYCVVMPHPYFVIVNSDGTFLLEDVPPGKYTLVSWHEYFGVIEKEIQVKENQPVAVDFEYAEEL